MYLTKEAISKEFMDQSHPDEVLFVTGPLYFIAEVGIFLLGENN